MKTNFPNEYNGFALVSINEIPDCEAQGIYLRHKKTGLEVFHVLNDDSENLFAFAFRTPAKNSKGAAHIIEHSVLCGSEKFPLKEPFVNLMNQSVNTFLNAMTYPDKTVYPASSMIKSDYFNLMDVYADAVFFPLLDKQTFMQEAHRLEINDKGEYEIQGVVYNEMKGCYSTFDSVASDLHSRLFFPDTNYAFDYGGDPLVIPSFSYDDFKAFHKKYYSPENCILFLYGNIPTEEQLDFLNEKFMSRLEKKYPSQKDFSPDSKVPFVNEEFVKMETYSKFEKPLNFREKAPSSGAKGSLVTVNWISGETKNLLSYMECAFLSEILIGNDGSPLSKALLDSALGDELAPSSGVSNDTKNFVISLGLHGVKEKDEQKVYKIIFDSLEKIRNEGISKAHIDSAIMALEFANREIVRAGGPFSLVLLDRTLSAWNYGEEPYKGLEYRNTFERIRERAESDEKYVQELLGKYIFENNECIFIQVEPSSSYFAEREKREKKMILEISKDADKEKINDELNSLHSYQHHHETEEELKCIPHLKIKDLNTKASLTQNEFSVLKAGKENVLFFKNIQNTNGIAYFELGFPLDSISPSDYKYLTLFSYFATNCGWNGKSWADCSMESGVKTGGIGVRILSQEMPKTEKSKVLFEDYKKYNFCGRDWIFISVKLLSEKMEEGLKLFEECVTSYEFNDLKRMKNLLDEAKSVLKSSVVPSGTRYASIRSQCGKSHSLLVDEILRGFTQFFFVESLSNSKRGLKKLADKFYQIRDSLFKSGAIMHLVADKETSEKMEKLVPSFASKIGLKSLSHFSGFDDSALKNEILLSGEKSLPDFEIFSVPTQVGFSACAINSAYFGTRENAAELLASHWLSANLLWERIRTSGGAYGAYASSANLSGLFMLSTFRDPNPFRSVEVFRECLKDLSKMQIPEEECLRTIIGTYGDEVQPQSPYSRGRTHFARLLYCISDEDRSEKLEYITELKPEDMNNCAFRLFKSSENNRKVVICSEAELRKFREKNNDTKNCGVIIKLHL